VTFDKQVEKYFSTRRHPPPPAATRRHPPPPGATRRRHDWPHRSLSIQSSFETSWWHQMMMSLVIKLPTRSQTKQMPIQSNLTNKNRFIPKRKKERKKEGKKERRKERKRMQNQMAG